VESGKCLPLWINLMAMWPPSGSLTDMPRPAANSSLHTVETYHMIDRCDPTIATWSINGDNFIIKNVECFSSKILPQYFKHSNFSSFARQLNFYGFRKLKAEPILTADFDAQTASYVRFYHDKFQKDKPELLHNIKRATKSDQQSKDDVESLKAEISQLKECISTMSADFDRKIAEMSYQFNHRVATMSSEFEKLAALMQQSHAAATGVSLPSATHAVSAPVAIQPAPQAQAPPPPPPQPSSSSTMLQSLSRVAGMRLAHPSPAVGPQPSTAAAEAVPALGEKRPAEEDLSAEKSRLRSV